MGGACVGDFNGDGWPDIYALKGGNGVDALYINNHNGTFSDQAAAWGLLTQHCGVGCAVGDFDRDGWQDIYVTSYGKSNNNLGEIGKNRLLRNTGLGSFEEIAVQAGVNVTSTIASSGNGVAWGDYDLDGDLDLFAAAWSASAAGNRLFRNEGNGTFSNQTGIAITIPTVTWGFQPSFVDLDGDRYPEILLAADFGTTRIFHNNRNGTFTETTDSCGMNSEEFGMGQCVADFDRDGDLDCYVTGIFARSPNPAFHNGNSLYVNSGASTYVESAAVAGLLDGGWGWGLAAVDIDQDGWIDIIESNGRNSPEWAEEPEYFFHNDGIGIFTRDDAVSSQFLNADGRCVVTLDYDRDGDRDVLIFYNLGPLKLYRNDTTPPLGGAARWLQVELRPGSNPFVAPSGYGTRLVAKIGSTSIVRYMDGGNGYLGSSELVAHFGLGTAPVIDELRIEWARGYVTTLHNVQPNQRLTVTAPRAADFDANGVVDADDIGLLMDAWGPTTLATLHFDLDSDGAVGPRDLSLALGSWGSR